MTNEEVNRSIEKDLVKKIKEKYEEKIRRGGMNSIIIHGIKDTKQGISQRRKEEGIKKAQQLFKEGCGVDLTQQDITTVVHLGKCMKIEADC